MSKIMKRNTEQIISSIIKYSSQDHRIDLLRKFMGIGDDKIKREILDCYIFTLKHLPLSLYKAFEEGENNYFMTLENCIEIYVSKFSIYNLNIENLERILRHSIVIVNEKEIDEYTTEHKRDLFFLYRFYTKANHNFQLLFNNYKNQIQTSEKDVIIADMIIKANHEYNLNLAQVIDILKRNFTPIGDKIQLESFVDFFVTKYIFKIKINDFIQQSFECFNIIFNDLDRNLQEIWLKGDYKRCGIIHFKDFELMMNLVMGQNTENTWKISEYFK